MGYGIRYGLTAAGNLHSFYMFKSCYHHYAQILKGQHMYRLRPGRYEHRVMSLWNSIFICMTKYYYVSLYRTILRKGTGSKLIPVSITHSRLPLYGCSKI